MLNVETLSKRHKDIPNRYDLYRAVTIRPTGNRVLPLVQRKRALEYINRPSTTGTVPFLVGPLGSGKSTTALQWMAQHGGSFQYVSVRPLKEAPPDWIDQPDDFGDALADLFNSCALPVAELSALRIEENLIRVVELSRTTSRQFVIDDVEMLTRAGMNMLQPLLAPNLAIFQFGHAMLISRAVDSYVLGNLKELGTLRVVLPSTLEFDVEEAREAHRLGIFGAAEINEVLEARENTGGWFAGMLASMGNQGGKTIGPRTFESYLLNEMLLLQSKPMLHITMASACLPVFSDSLWNDLFDHYDLPHWLIASTLSALPIRATDPQRSSFEIVPVMRDALQRLIPVTTDGDWMDDLIKIAMAWYVRHGHLKTAAALAKKKGLEESLITLFKPLCTQHAETENWTAILDILGDLPKEILVQDSGLSFWFFHGLVENDRWLELRQFYDQIEPLWSMSSDATTQANLHLVQSWSAYVFSRGIEAKGHAEAAYAVLPANAHRARMWAAGSASIAESLRGYSAGARKWSARANLEQTFIHQSSRWWHNNAGVTRYSWLANHGMLEETYELCTRQTRSIGESDSSTATRYLILNAQIDIERLRLDSAEALLDRAVHVSDGKYAHQHHLRVAKSNLARARGNLDSAWEILSLTSAANVMRYDQYIRENSLRTLLALEMGDVDTADLLLGGAPGMDESWIKNFGDAHPQLLKARILQANGQPDEGLALAQSVLLVAKERNQKHVAIVAHSTLAYMFDLSGDTALRDHAIEAADLLAGDSGMELAFVVGGGDVRQLRSQIADSMQDPVLQADRLTEREVEILALVAQQHSNKAIAEALFVSLSTVKNHLSNVFDKLGTNNRQSAVRRAKGLGLLNH